MGTKDLIYLPQLHIHIVELVGFYKARCSFDRLIYLLILISRKDSLDVTHTRVVCSICQNIFF